MYLRQGNGLTQSVKTESQTVHNVQKADSGVFQLLDGRGEELSELGGVHVVEEHIRRQAHTDALSREDPHDCLQIDRV